LSLLRDVFGVEQPEQFVEFESRAHIDHRGFIYIIIPSTRVLIEQKSLDIDLRKPIKQSDGTLLTPFQQAKRYITELPLKQFTFKAASSVAENALKRSRFSARLSMLFSEIRIR